MALDLSKIQADVTAQQGTVNSAVTLLQQLVAAINAISTSDPQTQAQLDSLAASIEANTTALANAVAANPVPGSGSTGTTGPTGTAPTP